MYEKIVVLHTKKFNCIIIHEFIEYQSAALWKVGCTKRLRMIKPKRSPIREKEA